MTKSLKLDWQIHLLFAAIVVVALLFVATPQVAAQAESWFKVGDRLEADIFTQPKPNTSSATVTRTAPYAG